jgi:hypothetical protein
MDSDQSLLEVDLLATRSCVSSEIFHLFTVSTLKRKYRLVVGDVKWMDDIRVR